MTSKEIINHYVYVGKFNSQTDLAKHLGVTSSRVTNWKSGDKIPDKHLNRLIAEFGHFENTNFTAVDKEKARRILEKAENTDSFKIMLMINSIGYRLTSYSECVNDGNNEFKASLTIEKI